MQRTPEQYDAHYGRVSSDEQERNTSLQTQLEECLKLAVQDGGVIPERMRFQDVSTGTQYRERSKLTELRKEVWAGRVRRLYLYAFDRLSRNQGHMHILMEELKEFGVEVHCVTEAFENSPMGHMVLSLRAFMAEQEYEKIRLRTQTGRRHRAKLGYLIVGRKARFGYSYIDIQEGEKVWPKAGYAINQEEAALVRRIFDCYACQRMSMCKIAALLTAEGIPSPQGNSHWHPATIIGILKCRDYTGEGTSFKAQCVFRQPRGTCKTCYQQTTRAIEDQYLLREGVVPAIIDPETFLRAQQLLKTNKQDNRRNDPDAETYFLRGFLRCGYCQRAMAKEHNPRQDEDPYYYYRCHKKTMCSNPCHGTTIPAHHLNQMVWEAMDKLLADRTILQRALVIWQRRGASTQDLQAMERTINRLKETQEQLARDLMRRDEHGEFYLAGNMRDLALKQAQDLEHALRSVQKDYTMVVESSDSRNR